MAAARTAAEAGADVLLIDSAAQVGGEYLRRSAFDGVRDELHARITHLAETTVWAIEPGPDGTQRLRLQTGPADAPGRRMRTIDATALVLATGAYDRVLPFPGWDLPGVYTAGAAQALAKGQGIAVGRRVLVAGTGPFLLPVARSLTDVGAEVLAVLEANSTSTIARGWRSAPLGAARKLPEFLSYSATLVRNQIPSYRGLAVVAAHGVDRVEAVTIAELDDSWKPLSGSERRLEVDAVCLGYGFTAQLELAVAAGCTLVTAADGGSAVEVDSAQRTSVPGVYAAGEITGVAGAGPAAAEGAVAGAYAANAAGADFAARLLRVNVAQGKKMATALARAYPVRPGWRSWVTVDTIVCRCEEVRYADLAAALDRAEPGRALKLTSRAGLGMCQGRVCARTVAELAAAPEHHEDARRQPDVLDHLGASRRPIAVPVRMRDLASTPLEES